MKWLITALDPTASKTGEQMQVESYAHIGLAITAVTWLAIAFYFAMRPRKRTA